MPFAAPVWPAGAWWAWLAVPVVVAGLLAAWVGRKSFGRGLPAGVALFVLLLLPALLFVHLEHLRGSFVGDDDTGVTLPSDPSIQSLLSSEIANGRLAAPNGNTLLGSINTNQLVEVDRAGKEVWKVTTPIQPLRIYRR